MKSGRGIKAVNVAVGWIPNVTKLKLYSRERFSDGSKWRICFTERSRDYVLLAQIAGASNTRIIFRHILPGVINMVIVTATLGTGTIILTEASLSFLGAGIPPPDPTWGKMVGDERMYVGQAWWTSFFPGIAIAMVVMSGNFLGDWMRDRFDPTLRQL